MLAQTTSWSIEEAARRVGCALAAIGIVVGVAHGPATAFASIEPGTQEPTVWVSAASAEPAPHDGADRQAIELARAELQRASRTLGVIRHDLSNPSIDYVQAIAELLQPFEAEEPLQLSDLHRISTGLEQAWSNLVAQAGGTPLIVELVEVDERIAVAAVSSHPTRPRVEDPRQLEPVLRHNVELVGLVFEALSAATAEFEEHATLSIESFVDPEAPAPQPRAYLVVRTTLSVDAALDRMDRFEERWWAENSHRAGGLLSVAIDYV